MNTFPKPNNLNGEELIDELKAAGLIVDKIFDFSDGSIGFDTDNEKKALEIVKGHNGTVVAPEPSIEDKLSSVGLSLSDLKKALGL